MQNSTRVLLVEDDPADAYIFRRYLQKDSHCFDLEHVAELASGLDRLQDQEFEILLLDLALPDSLGLETFHRATNEVPDTPIIVLTGNDDEDLALRAVRDGAQDYLLKAQVTGPLLVRAIRYAIERHQMQRSLLNLSLTDDLTELYNRRGFQTLAGHQLKQAARAGKQLALIFADLDGLKDLNDTQGHSVGNDALIEMADILRQTFRDSDIVARLGGDEFVVLLVNARQDGVRVPVSRLRRNIERANEAPDRVYPLSVSIGYAVGLPEGPGTLEDLLEQADQAMYREKRGKRKIASG